MTKHPNIAILILAAGESSRMGAPKQLLPWKQTTLLGQALSLSKSVSEESIFVVLGANVDNIRKSIESEDARIIFNPNYRTGQGSSLALGIDYLMKQEKKYDGVLLMLCDQPLLTTGYLQKLQNVFAKGKKGIVATRYGKKSGVPVIIHSKYFEALKNIRGDIGARRIIEENGKDTILLDAGDEEKLDIDTKEEYEYLFNRYGL